MGRFRAPGPIFLLMLSSMVMESAALSSHPLTAHLVAAQDQVPPDPAAPSVSPTAVPEPSIDDLEAEMLARLNAERSAAGVGTLKDQPWAHSVARQHSEDMAGAGSIWHNMSGYMDQGHRVLGPYLGENVSMDRTLEANDARLLASPEHHRNIVDPQFNSVGVGIARDANGWVYVTEDFSAVSHVVVAQAVKAAPAPAPSPAIPAPPVPAPAALPPVPAGAPAPPRPGAQPAPAAAVPGPAAAVRAPAGGVTAAPPPDLVATSRAAPASPVTDPVQGVAVPAPVEAPPARVPAAAVALAAPALPTAAPPGTAAPSGAPAGTSQPLDGWVGLAPERARRLLPAAAVVLYIGALLFSRGNPGSVRPPGLGDPVVAGSGSRPLRSQGRSFRPWICELPRGPPVVPRISGCFA